MKNIKIFEIPIYSTSQSSFNEKWNFKKQEYIEWSCKLGNEYNYAKRIFSEIYLPYSIWIYNRIIGYISLSINNKDIVLDLYLSKNKKFPFDSQKRSFIQFVPTNGLHFYSGHMSDQDIKNEIQNYIDMINKDFLNNKRYIDLSVYNSIIGYLNIKKIIDDLNI